MTLPSYPACRELVRVLMDAPEAQTTGQLRTSVKERRDVTSRLAREAETSLDVHPAWFAARTLDELDEEAVWAFWFVETFKGRGPELLGQCGPERTIALAGLHEHAQKQCHEAAVFARFARHPEGGDREAERERDIDQAIFESEYEYAETADREAERDEWLAEFGHLYSGGPAAIEAVTGAEADFE